MAATNTMSAAELGGAHAVKSKPSFHRCKSMPMVQQNSAYYNLEDRIPITLFVRRFQKIPLSVVKDPNKFKLDHKSTALFFFFTCMFVPDSRSSSNLGAYSGKMFQLMMNTLTWELQKFILHTVLKKSEVRHSDVTAVDT